jgi:amidohydrolase
VLKKHNLPGKIVVFGTPAEEGGGGKIKLLQAGAYRDYEVDINLISHPGIAGNCALTRTTAYHRFKVAYAGREAHAAAAPWMGINALDALITAYNALSVLRQQTMPGDVIQGYITEGGVAPNIIHARAAGVFVVRADTQARLRELMAKVDNCFAAGALATGAKLEVTPEQAYADHVPNRALARSYTRYFNSLRPDGGLIATDQDVDEVRGRTMASTDQGDVSYAMPSLSPAFAILPGPLGTGPHSPEFAESAGTRDAFDRALRVGKGLAGTAIDVFTREGLLEEVKKEWREAMKGDETV